MTVVNTTATTSLSSLNITVDSIYNPSNDTLCNTTDISMLERTYFRVKVLDLSTNRIIVETSSTVDARTCLTFSSYRIPISVSFFSTMQSGLVSTMNYSIRQPTNSLKLTPYCSNLGITFSPKTIDFSNYNTSTVANSIVIRSDVTPGSYWINFTKSESTAKTYYKPVLPILVKVVTGASAMLNDNATVRAVFDSYSYIGYPIVVPILLSVPSATPLTLVLTVKEEINGSLLRYSQSFGNYSISPRVIQIAPGINSTNFTILYFNSTVPPCLTILLSLSSIYPLVHRLTTPTLYVSFFKDPKYQGLYPPMKVIVSETYLNNADDVGKSILNVFVNNQTQNVSFAPVIIRMSQIERGSTWSNLLINTKEEYTLYYCVQEVGYKEPVSYRDLEGRNNPNCRDQGKLDSYRNASNLVNCIAWINSTVL